MHIAPQICGDGGALLLQNLCFPGDLWWLQGVGRSCCDYCLHPDLYLSFNYLRVSAACWCPYVPSLGTGRGERDSSMVSTMPAHRDPVSGDPVSGDPVSSPEQSWWVAPMLTARVGAEIWSFLSPSGLRGPQKSHSSAHLLSFFSSLNCPQIKKITLDWPNFSNKLLFFWVFFLNLHHRPCSAPDSQC